MKEVINNEKYLVSGGAKCMCGSDARYGDIFSQGGAVIEHGTGFYNYCRKSQNPIRTNVLAGCKKVDFDGELESKALCVTKCCDQLGSWGYIWGSQELAKC